MTPSAAPTGPIAQTATEVVWAIFPRPAGCRAAPGTDPATAAMPAGAQAGPPGTDGRCGGG